MTLYSVFYHCCYDKVAYKKQFREDKFVGLQFQDVTHHCENGSYREEQERPGGESSEPGLTISCDPLVLC